VALILCTVAIVVPAAWAHDYEVTASATTTNDGHVLNSGDTLTVASTGSVRVDGQFGLQTTVGGTIITHNGPITTTGDYAYGIVAGTDGAPITGDVTILGTGNITTQGYEAQGIYSALGTGDATITAGDISTTGDVAAGIWSGVDDGNSTITAGDISTTGDYAAGIYSYVDAGNSTITARDISTQGDGIYSLVVTGDSMITVGDIATQGDNAAGIWSEVTTGNSTITAGDISTKGDVAFGIGSIVLTGDATITAGDISTQGLIAFGIHSTVGTGDATITAGDISTTGVRAHGIVAAFVEGGTSTLSIFNDQTIAVTGEGSRGIQVYAEGNSNTGSIVNTGKIYSALSYGIETFGSGMTITNSGTIFGGGAAVWFVGTGNRLSLLSGSNVQGILDIAGSGGNTLTIAPRLNTALRFTGGDSVILDTNGMPYAAFGGILAVVDPTVYAAEDDMLGDLTRSLADVVDGRLGFVTGHRANNVRVSTSNAEASGSQWATWATGIGNYRSQTADGIYDGFDTTLGGFALGTNGVLSSGTTFGGFVGASRAHVNTNAGNEQIDTATAYAGLYAGYTLPNAFVNLAVTGGYANTDTSRDVLNNMVVGGIEQAKGNPDGVFLAPQATIGTEIKNAHGIVTPSLRIAYTRLTMGSYEETGSAADMSVGSRTVNVVDLRGQVAFAIKPIVTSTGQFDATMRLGADATLTNSDDIIATLLDQPITFSTSSQDTTLRGFAGVDLVQAMNSGANLKLSVEAGYDSGHAVTLKGTAGLAWAF